MEMDPGPLTVGHGSLLGLREGSEMMLCAAGLASAKQAASLLWAIMDLSGAEDSGHDAGPSFAIEPDATCQPCFV